MGEVTQLTQTKEEFDLDMQWRYGAAGGRVGQKALDINWEKVDEHFQGKATPHRIAQIVGCSVGAVYDAAHKKKVRIRTTHYALKDKLANTQEREE